MAKYTGKDGSVKAGGAAAPVVNLTGFTLDESGEELEASIIDGNNVKSVEAGQTSWSGSIETLYDPVDAGQVALPVNAKVALELYPTGDATDQIKKDGTALITSVSTPVPVNGMIAQSYTFVGDGILTTTTIV